MEPKRTGKTVVPGAVTGRTLVPGQGPGLDQMLEVVTNAPDPAAPQAFLLVISGSEPGRLHVLDRPELLIGRSKYASIQINERAISQQHAKLVRMGDHHRLFDLGSTNGTFVNDQRIEQVDLRIGDVVRLGETTFTYMTSSGGDPSQTDATMALPAAGQGGQAHGPSTAGPIVRRGPVSPARPSVPHPAQVIEAPPYDDDGTDFIAMLMKVLAFFNRYWLSILILTVLGTAAGIASYKVVKPPATAEFEINLIPNPTDNPVAHGKRSNFEFFRAAKSSFTRPALIADTLQQLGETEVTPARIRAVQKRLSFNQARGSQITYAGTFEAPSAQDAIDYLKVHLKLFLESEIDKALKVLLVEVQTLQQQLEDAENELEATEQAVLAFKQEHTEGLPEQGQELMQRYIELGSERGRAASEVARASAALSMSKRRLKSESPLIESRIEMARPYEDAIADIKKQLATAKATGKGAQHPDVIALKTQLKKFEGLRDDVMANGTTEIIKSKNPVYADARRTLGDAEMAYKIAQAEMGRLTNDYKKAQSIVAELPRLQAEYSELTRDYEATKTIHDNLFQKLTESQIQLEMERASTSARYDLITPPNVKPISPIKEMAKRGFVLGVLGFILGVGLGLLRDLRRLIHARMAQLG